MAIILSHPMTSDEIRVLQEFRRLRTDTLPLATIKSIKHPAGGGETPARTLAGKGYLAADAAGETFALTEKAKQFLALDPVPQSASSSGADKPPDEE